MFPLLQAKKRMMKPMGRLILGLTGGVEHLISAIGADRAVLPKGSGVSFAVIIPLEST